jgi:hypothetical protein
MRYFGFISLLLFIACKPSEDRSCLKLSGSKKQVVRQLTNFNEISIDDNIDVTIFQSNRNEIEILAGENLVNFIRSDVNGNTLKIENLNRCNFLRNEKEKIHVSLFIPSFFKLVCNGYGNISIPNAFVATKLWIENLSYGNIDANVDLSDTLIVVLASSNKNVIRGKAKALYNYTVGVNELNTLDVRGIENGAIFAYTNLDISVAVDSNLFVNQLGKGTIYYKGDPIITSKNSQAKIVKLN